MKNQKKTMLILMIVQTMVFLIIFSFAWFASDFDPVIYSGELHIASTKGLEIQLEDLTHADDEAIDDEVNIKDIEKDLSEYRLLSQMSSSDGVNLFRRQIEDEAISYVEVNKEDKEYVDVTIKLLNKSNANNKDRLVYIDSFQIYFLDQEGNPRTDIPNYVYDTLRISLEIEESYGTEVIILGLCKVSDGKMTRYDEFKESGSISIYYGQAEDEILDQAVLTKYNDYDDFYDLNTAISSAGLSNETDPLVQARVLEKNPSSNFANRFRPQRVNYINKYLKVNPNHSNITTIPSGQGKKITFRLWLEGADPRCNSDISGSSIYMKLVFGSELAS